MKAMLLLLPLLAGLPPARAAPAGGEPTALLRDWAAQNSACRGGRGDDSRTQEACTRRDALDRRLNAAGWCYSRPGEAGYQRSWQPCAGRAPR